MNEKQAEAFDSVKVMSFNIAHGLGMDGLVNLEKTALVIENSQADVIGLQEVDRYFSSRSSFVDQVAWLGGRLGMYTAYGANLDMEPIRAGHPRRQYGNAILSKYPIKYVENHSLTPVHCEFGNNEQRGVLEAVVEMEGTLLHIFNTHLALKEEELKMSIDELLSLTKKCKLPHVLLGDFNAPPDHEGIQRLNRHFTDAFLKLKKGDAYTYPTRYTNAATGENYVPATRIDYIFSDHQLQAVGAAAADTAVSDHLPIIADFVLETAKTPVPPKAHPDLQKI
jgi:endonuclease/exonuclease/phosphatase family metal-dependent hydrolase